MISRRGLFSTIWCDNAKTFKCADREIQRLFTPESSTSKQLWDKIDKEELQAKLTSKGIKWKFIVERSPWRGGWWERLVRSVKEPLRNVLGKALLSYQELATVLTIIEADIHSRPLTSHDVRDLTPITRAHLVLGRSLFNLPDIPDEDSVNESATRQRYLYQQKLVNHFWKRWRGEYLHQLSIRQKWVDEQPALKVGDIVLISEDNAPRGKWPMGRVERLFPGRDGLICTVTLKTKRGLLRSPVQRLHRLEASSTQFASDEFDDSGPNGGESSAIRKVKKKVKKEQAVKKPAPSLQRYWRGGEDVRAGPEAGDQLDPPCDWNCS